MRFHNSLKQLVRDQGQEILTNIQLHAFLLDVQAYNSFEDHDLKDCVQSIIQQNAIVSFLSLQKWDTSAVKYATDFAKANNLDEQEVNYIFKSIAYAIGWITEKKLLNVPTKHSPRTGKSTSPQNIVNNTSEDTVPTKNAKSITPHLASPKANSGKILLQPILALLFVIALGLLIYKCSNTSNDTNADHSYSVTITCDTSYEVVEAQEEYEQELQEAHEEVRRQMKEAEEEVRRQMKEAEEEVRRQMKEAEEEARRQMKDIW